MAIHKKSLFLFHQLSAVNLLFLPFFGGRNPSKQNLSHGNPEFTSAGIRAVGPGRVSTGISFSTHVLTSKKPGSEIPGVPASDIRAIVCPERILEQTDSTLLCSLNI